MDIDIKTSGLVEIDLPPPSPHHKKEAVNKSTGNYIITKHSNFPFILALGYWISSLIWAYNINRASRVYICIHTGSDIAVVGRYGGGDVCIERGTLSGSGAVGC